MKAARKFWSGGARFLICFALLTWIFHSIFTNEGRLALEQAGQSWAELTRAEQWRAAWAHGPQALWRTLTLVQPAALFASFLLVGAALLLGVIRWNIVLRVQGIRLPFVRAAEISLVGHFFNSFLLGSTGGDLFKAYYAARETRHRKTEAVTTVVVDRLIGLLSMLLFALAMMLPQRRLLAADERISAPALVIVGMLAGLAALAAAFFWPGLSKRFPRGRQWLRALPKGDQLERSLEACRRFGQDGRFLFKAVALSMLLNVACVLQFLILARALRLEIPVAVLFFLVPVIICIAALPVTPSGLGVRENLFVVMLGVPGLDVPPTEALSLSLLAYAGSLAWSVVGGAVYAFFRERHHLGEVAAAA